MVGGRVSSNKSREKSEICLSVLVALVKGRLIYTNVHPYMLFIQSMRTYYMAEAINIQIFPQDTP